VVEPKGWKDGVGPALRFGPTHISSIENKENAQPAMPAPSSKISWIHQRTLHRFLSQNGVRFIHRNGGSTSHEAV
jgi:hypothetical protein